MKKKGSEIHSHLHLEMSPLTWSPRFKPASVALLPESTLSTKMPKPFSEPPSKMKGRGASRDGFVSVISLRFAFAAHAMFNSLRWPPIFCKSSGRGASTRGQAEEDTLHAIHKNSQTLPLFPDYFQILLEIESLRDPLRSHWSDYSPTAILHVSPTKAMGSRTVSFSAEDLKIHNFKQFTK